MEFIGWRLYIGFASFRVLYKILWKRGKNTADHLANFDTIEAKI